MTYDILKSLLFMAFPTPNNEVIVDGNSLTLSWLQINCDGNKNLWTGAYRHRFLSTFSKSHTPNQRIGIFQNSLL